MVMVSGFGGEVAALVGSLPARSAGRVWSVLAQLGVFAETDGVGGGTEALLDYDVIEAFCVRGLAGRSSATRGTYRSVLYRLAEMTVGPPERRSTPLAGARAPAPYSQAERAELISIARAQRPGPKRASAQTMVAAGLGAGLGASELVALRGSDVTPTEAGAVVRVGGRRQRTVPVTAPHDAVLVALARRVGGGVLFRPGLANRGYKNAVNDLARHLVTDPDAPRFGLGRARASFICDHLAAGTPLATLLAISGICEVESLARYAAHVEGVGSSKARLRRRLEAERR